MTSPGAAAGRMYADSERYKHFKASDEDAAYSGLTDDQRYIEVRYEGADWQGHADQRPVDEIVTSGLHLEMEDSDSAYMIVKGLRVSIYATRVKGERKPRLVVTCYPDDCAPVVVEQDRDASPAAQGAAL